MSINKNYDVYSTETQLKDDCTEKYLPKECDGYYDIVVTDASYARLQVGKFEIDMERSLDGSTFTLSDITIDNPLCSSAYGSRNYISTDGKVNCKQIFLQNKPKSIYLYSLDIVCVLKSRQKILLDMHDQSYIFDFNEVTFLPSEKAIQNKSARKIQKAWIKYWYEPYEENGEMVARVAQHHFNEYSKN